MYILLRGQRWRITLAAWACMVALISIGRIYAKNFLDNRFDNSNWGLDFYQFWYGGHFFWQGEEPYTSIQYSQPPKLKEPRVPIHLSDNRNRSHELTLHRRWPVNIIPGAAPLFLLMTPLSLLPWVHATIVWSAVNIMLGIALIWLLMRSNGDKLVSVDGSLLLGLFFSMIAVRQTIELGQTSLITTTSMYGALLLANSHPILAGSLLAVSTSKYTIGLPVLIYFLYRRWLKEIAICIAIHLSSVLVLAGVSHANPLKVVQAYIAGSTTVLQQTEEYAIHLLAMGWGPLAHWLVGIGTVTVIVSLMSWHRRSTPQVREDMLSAYTLMGIGSLWSLLSLYHGRHDMVAAFVPIAIMILRTGRKRTSHLVSLYELTSPQQTLLYIFIAIVLLVWSLPLYVLTGTTAYRWVYVGCNMGVLVLLELLLFKVQLSTTPTQR